MTDEIKIIEELLELMQAAIVSGDWKADGACDPEAAMKRAENHVKYHNPRKHGRTRRPKV